MRNSILTNEKLDNFSELFSQMLYPDLAGQFTKTHPPDYAEPKLSIINREVMEIDLMITFSMLEQTTKKEKEPLKKFKSEAADIYNNNRSRINAAARRGALKYNPPGGYGRRIKLD